jgi:hypothetical protein
VEWAVVEQYREGVPMLIACAKRLALFLLLATGAYGQSLFRYENIVINQSGVPIAGANIYVCAGNVTPNFSNSPPCTLQTVYSDLAGTQVIGQPIVSTNGSSTQFSNFAFTVTAGVMVTLAINGAGVQGSDVVTIPLVAAGTTASSLAGPGSITGNFSGNFGLSGNIAYTGNQTFSNPGTFSNGQMNNYVSASLNSCSFSTEIGANANATEAIAGCLSMPSSIPGTPVNNGAAIAGFVNSSCDAGGAVHCNAVGGYFQGVAKVNNSAIWGLNSLAYDVPGLTNHWITGLEIDIGVAAGSTPDQVSGIDIMSNGSGTPGPNSYAINIVPAAGGFRWAYGMLLQRNASTAGIVLDGQSGAANTPSQAVNFIGYDSGNVPHTSSIDGNASGDIQFHPSTGHGYSALHNGGGIQIPGSTSGATTLAAPATGGGVQRFPSGTGTVTNTIASGVATMTASSISTLSCGATVTVSAPNVLTTDAIAWSYNAAPLANPGELVVSAWPTSGNVNFQYCNPTAGSVTPSAATLNWRVTR